MSRRQTVLTDGASDSDGSASLRPFSASLPMALLRAREMSMRLFRPLLAEHGLTEQQWRVLRALTAAEESLEAGELAETTSLLSPSLSRILVALERRDLIARRSDPDDGRRSLIDLSPGGVALVATVAPHSERRYAAIESEFGPDRLARLLAELHHLSELDVAIENSDATQ